MSCKRNAKLYYSNWPHLSKRTLCWGQVPRDFLMSSMSLLISRPLILAVPADGGNKPVRIELKVH